MHRLSRARASSRGHDRRSVHTALLVVHVEELPRGRPSESGNVRVKQDKHGTREQDRLPRAGKSCGPPRSAGNVRVKQDPHARHQQDARGLPGTRRGSARLGGARSGLAGLGGAWRGLAGRGAAWPGSARLGGAAWRGLAGRGAGVSGDGRPVTPVSCFWVRRVRWCVQAAFRRGYAPRSVRACALRSDCGYALRPLGRYPLHSVNGPAQRPSRRYAASCSWVLCLSCLTRTFSGCDWSPELSGATAQSGGTHQIKPERKRRATAKPDR